MWEKNVLSFKDIDTKVTSLTDWHTYACSRFMLHTNTFYLKPMYLCRVSFMFFKPGLIFPKLKKKYQWQKRCKISKENYQIKKKIPNDRVYCRVYHWDPDDFFLIEPCLCQVDSWTVRVPGLVWRVLPAAPQGGAVHQLGQEYSKG